MLKSINLIIVYPIIIELKIKKNKKKLLAKTYKINFIIYNLIYKKIKNIKVLKYFIYLKTPNIINLIKII